MVEIDVSVGHDLLAFSISAFGVNEKEELVEVAGLFRSRFQHLDNIIICLKLHSVINDI
jgi:ABC-type lipoprotein release transport system permease subunit